MINIQVLTVDEISKRFKYALTYIEDSLSEINKSELQYFIMMDLKDITSKFIGHPPSEKIRMEITNEIDQYLTTISKALNDRDLSDIVDIESFFDGNNMRLTNNVQYAVPKFPPLPGITRSDWIRETISDRESKESDNGYFYDEDDNLVKLIHDHIGPDFMFTTSEDSSAHELFRKLLNDVSENGYGLGHNISIIFHNRKPCITITNTPVDVIIIPNT